MAEIQPIEIAELIVETLLLEESPSEIDFDEALFNEGLALDSIDALELSLELAKRYGVEILADDEANVEIFASVRSLTAFVNRARAGEATNA